MDKPQSFFLGKCNFNIGEGLNSWLSMDKPQNFDLGKCNLNIGGGGNFLNPLITIFILLVK